MFSNRFLHKSYFKKLMLLSVVSPGRWKPERRAKEREEGRDHTPRASQAYPNGAGNVPPGQVESGLTMPSHEG